MKTILCLFAAIVALAQAASAEVLAYKFGTLLSTNVTVGPDATNTLSGQTALELRPEGIGISGTLHTTNAVGKTVILNFEVSVDGTNYSTVTPVKLILPFNSGSTAIRGFTNWGESVLSGARKIRLSSIINEHTNATTVVSNIHYFTWTKL